MVVYGCNKALKLLHTLLFNNPKPLFRICQHPLCQATHFLMLLLHQQDKASKVLSLEAKSTPLCQVETCGKELGSLSTYHQRCHICEVHIKEQQFMRAGKLQRFCQQCGRCHELSAFQGPKRSCREQLAKHNARHTFISDLAVTFAPLVCTKLLCSQL